MEPIHSSDPHRDSVVEFMRKANQAIPETPTIPSEKVRELRANLIMEESMETITDGLGMEPIFTIMLPSGELATGPVNDWGFVASPERKPDPLAIADGCADLKVVTIGTEIACGIHGKPIFEEVMESNMTKFIDGHEREDGKWVKGPSYRPPNIEPILKQQGMK